MVKKECGSGVTYAMCYVSLIVIFTIFACFVAQQKGILVKQTIENGLQICECFVLAKEYDPDDIGEQDRERYRRHIIPSVSYEPSVTEMQPQEQAEVFEVAESFSAQFRKHFDLNAQGYPTTRAFSDIVSQVCIDNFTIIEAVYSSDNAIIGFVCYDVQFYENAYVTCEKSYLPAGAALDGTPLGGSTIYSSAVATLNIFGKITTTVKRSAIVDIVLQSE